MTSRRGAAVALAALLAVGLGGCRYDSPADAGTGPAARLPTSATAQSASPPGGAAADPSPPTASAQGPAPPVTRPDPMARALLTIPAIGVRGVAVVAYRGTPDDAPGTRIQNRGPAASPRGPGGGVGPGEVGNYLVTGHRTSHSAPFADLPDLRVGERVRVRVGDTTFVYEVTQTRRTSFRSARSLARQAAAVPGRPGATPTQAMITLSTCATPEDRAAGNYWSDEFGNPEHRIDRVGVLVDVVAR